MDSKEQLQEMSFWDHVGELRSVLVKIAVVLVILAVALFALMPTIFDEVILAPCHGDFCLYRLFESITSGIPSMPQFTADGFEVKLINIQLASQFFIHMSTSFWLAVVIGFPIFIYLLWTFVSPGLYEKEKRGAKRAFFMGMLMFFMGVAVGYFVVFPITLRFLAEYQVSTMVPNQISLDSYMDTFTMLIFLMGLVFEMPLVAWLVGKTGLLHREFFGKYRRHAVVVLLLLAAIITPTGDPFTLTIVFLPVYGLYEFSACLVKSKPVNDDDDAYEPSEGDGDDAKPSADAGGTAQE